MLTTQAVRRFGSRTAIASALSHYTGTRIHKQSVYKWRRLVPPLRAAQLAVITRGSQDELHFDVDKYRRWRRGG